MTTTSKQEVRKAIEAAGKAARRACEVMLANAKKAKVTSKQHTTNDAAPTIVPEAQLYADGDVK